MTGKAAPFSMRLSHATDELVSREARRTHRTKGAVVEALAEEALRTRRFPGVAFRGSDWNRRAWVIGTALDVWEIAGALRSFGSDAQLAAESGLTEVQIALARAYAAEFAEEIADAITDNERPLDALRREYPTIATLAAD